MELMTISQLSKGFNISTRTLRYYEQLGILSSQKKDNYAYRVYDESTVKRLQQIIILRKLRIPLKQIALILNDTEQVHAIDIFQQSLSEINDEIVALSTIRSITNRLLVQLNKNIISNEKSTVAIGDAILNDMYLLKIVDSLSLSKIDFKEEKSMGDLNKADQVLTNLKDIRILYIPPMVVASSHYIGDNPEEFSFKFINDFVKENNLYEIKPDLRTFGFNNPCPQKEGDTYGYEVWVTIPEDMNLPEPLVKKQFSGGLYSAHCIKMGDFHEWQYFYEWVLNNDEYVFDSREPLGMDGSMEEHLNAYSYYKNADSQAGFTQLDLLIPIKPKESSGDEL